MNASNCNRMNLWMMKDNCKRFASSKSLLISGLVPPGRLGQVRQAEEVHDGGEHGAQGTQARRGLEPYTQFISVIRAICS